MHTEEDHGWTEATEDTDQLYIQFVASTFVRKSISVVFWKHLGIHSLYACSKASEILGLGCSKVSGFHAETVSLILTLLSLQKELSPCLYEYEMLFFQ